MKNLNKILYAFLAVIILSSCNNDLDINTDPNNPQQSQLTPSLQFPGAVTRSGSTLVVTMNQLGNTFGGMWGGNVLEFSGPYNDEFRYNVTSTFYDNIWNNLYTRTSNFTSIINYSGDLNYDNHKAASYILRAFYFQYLVDLYGDIPFSEMHGFNQNLNPKYDDAQTVYRNLISDLNKAINLIDTTVDAEDMDESDVVFNGNMNMWKKFANTVKLRILMRQSLMTDADTQAHINSELSGLTSADFLSMNENVTMNPGYANDNNRQTPFYAAFGFAVNGQARNGNRSAVASKYIVDLLDGTSTGGVTDNRLQRLFRPNQAGNYVGIEQGALLGSLPAGTTLCQMGEGLGVASPSDANASKDAFLMTGMESMFLQSEAIERGYLTGNSQTMFENGISASYNYLGATDASTYINDIANVDGLGWNSTDKIEAIISQKWIALSGVNGIETWIEMTRTGFPNVPLSVSSTTGARPNRLLYPQSEISGNSANVPAQTVQDAFSTKIFWDVN